MVWSHTYLPLRARSPLLSSLSTVLPTRPQCSQVQDKTRPKLCCTHPVRRSVTRARRGVWSGRACSPHGTRSRRDLPATPSLQQGFPALRTTVRGCRRAPPHHSHHATHLRAWWWRTHRGGRGGELCCPGGTALREQQRGFGGGGDRPGALRPPAVPPSGPPQTSSGRRPRGSSGWAGPARPEHCFAFFREPDVPPCVVGSCAAGWPNRRWVSPGRGPTRGLLVRAARGGSLTPVRGDRSRHLVDSQADNF